MAAHRVPRCLPVLLVAAWAGVCAVASAAEAQGSAPGRREVGGERGERPTKPPLDRSARTQIGTASVYSRRLAGRPMADQKPMDPHDDNAASKTLPLGTKAKVTNLKTGRSATVTIEDRGPYVKGRIVDLSPATADKIGITPKEGVTKVEVAPLAPPARDGRTN